MQLRIAAVLLLVATLIAPQAPAQEQFPELLKNGDFAAWDKWPGDWDIFTGAKNGDGALSEVSAAEGGGITLQGGAPTMEWRSAGQQFPAAPETLYRLEFEARVLGRKLEGRQFKNCYVGLIFFGAGKQRLALRQFDVRSERWKAGRLTALSPPGTAAGSVFIVLTQTGALSVRNVSLKQAANDPLGNYDLLVSEMDQRYSYFAVKKVDWRAHAETFRPKMFVANEHPKQFSEYVRQFLSPLRDEHVWLQAAGGPIEGTAPKSERWAPTAFKSHLPGLLARVHQQKQIGKALITGVTKEGYGYALVGSLQPIGTTAEEMTKALEALYERPGIILDLRANGGGDERVAQLMLRGMVDQRRVYAQNRTRSGPAADDFTPPQSRVLHVSREAGVPRYTKPVVALIGPGCMSSGEAMALMCKALPNVTVIGAPTRGASGNPKPIALANGTTVMASTWVAMTADGTPFEGVGVQPDEVVEGDSLAPYIRALELLREKTKQ